MLPLLQAEEIKHSIVEYLKATFNFADRAVEQAFEDLLLDQRKGMFKGPYVQIRLPFEQFTDEKALRKCLEVRPSFYPYKHQ